jgi:hypothetical protein
MAGLILIALSAIWGATLAVDETAALYRLALIGAGIALFFVMQRAPAELLQALLLPLSALVLYFLVSAPWADRIGRFAPLDPLYQALSAATLPFGLPPLPVYFNTMAGALIITLALQNAAREEAQSSVGKFGWGAVCAVTAIALVLTLSRSALFAVAVVSALAAMWAVRERMPNRYAKHIVWAAPLALARLATSGGRGDALAGALGSARGAAPDVAALVGDYWLTGVGFDAFPMALSSYALLTTVPFLAHPFSLYAALLLNHGAFGLIGFVLLSIGALVAGWIEHEREVEGSAWLRAGGYALSAVLVLGFFDDPFHGDVHFLPLLFAPAALLLRTTALSNAFDTLSRMLKQADAMTAAGGGARGVESNGPVSILRTTPRAFALALGIVALGMGVIWLRPAWRGAALASLGAVAQSRYELRAFGDGSEWGLQDALRAASPAQLGASVSLYRQALALNPALVSANRRLGQIELAQGFDAAACERLDRAYQLSPDRASALLSGECIALAGDASGAAERWATVADRAQALRHRYNWYATFKKDAARADLMRAAMDRAGVTP